jgi:hypothetical protein
LTGRISNAAYVTRNQETTNAFEKFGLRIILKIKADTPIIVVKTSTGVNFPRRKIAKEGGATLAIGLEDSDMIEKIQCIYCPVTKLYPIQGKSKVHVNNIEIKKIPKVFSKNTKHSRLMINLKNSETRNKGKSIQAIILLRTVKPKQNPAMDTDNSERFVNPR